MIFHWPDILPYILEAIPSVIFFIFTGPANKIRSIKIKEELAQAIFKFKKCFLTGPIFYPTFRSQLKGLFLSFTLAWPIRRIEITGELAQAINKHKNGFFTGPKSTLHFGANSNNHFCHLYWPGP